MKQEIYWMCIRNKYVFSFILLKTKQKPDKKKQANDYNRK